MTELQKVITELVRLADKLNDRSIDLNDGLLRDYSEFLEGLTSILEAYQQRMGEPVAWMNSLNGVVISNIVEGGSKINLVRMDEFGFDTPLYAAPPVPEGMVLPCDVRLPPNLIIRKGCKIETLMEALKVRDGRDVQWADPKEAVKSLIAAAEKPG